MGDCFARSSSDLPPFTFRKTGNFQQVKPSQPATICNEYFEDDSSFLFHGGLPCTNCAIWRDPFCSACLSHVSRIFFVKSCWAIDIFFGQITRTILEKFVAAQDGKHSYAYDSYLFHISIEVKTHAAGECWGSTYTISLWRGAEMTSLDIIW